MGRPKKVKRAYHRKVVQSVEQEPSVKDEEVIEDAESEVSAGLEDEVVIEKPSELAKNLMDVVKKSQFPISIPRDGVCMASSKPSDGNIKYKPQNIKPLNKINPETIVGVKINEPAAEPVKQKQHQMFHSLAEGQIELEAAEREKRENRLKLEKALAEQEKKNNVGKLKLICPFCQHTQYSINSKDLTSAWCEVCGRCFQAEWK